MPSQELGRIEKPLAEKFAGKRKLYLVPLLFTSANAPKEYAEKFARYWAQVREQIRSLEAGTGAVKRVYHESVTKGGEEGLKMLAKLNPSSHRIVEDKRKRGAELEIIEDEELLHETMDWQRCLLLGLTSERAAKTVSELYAQSSSKRYEHMARRIDETLQEDEAGLLFIGEEHRVQFPQDIEVFYVSPPALDEIHRWLREQPKTKEG